MDPTTPSSQSDYGDFPSFTSINGEPQAISAHPPDEELPTTPDTPKASNILVDNDDHRPESHWNSEQMPPPRKPPVRPNAQMTSEEYNAQLLSDPRMAKSSVVNPEFLQQYYRESRLHHLSTWKAELKAQLQAAAREKLQSQVSKKEPVPGARRYILHVDFDSFFAAVALLKHPELRDKPVAIAHGSGSGSEIASCNYVARGRGVKNGMWMKGALEACPELQVLPYDFPAYEEASRKFYNSVLAIDGVVQSVSIDEALIDVTQLCLEAGGSDGRGISEGSIYREQYKADEIAQELRDSVKEKTGCAVSVGIGANILQAKVALRKAKPAGQFQLKPEAVLDYLGNLTVQDLPGVGYSLSAKLEDLGVKFVKDISDLSRERLVSSLGPKTGIRMWEYARGIDKTEVGNEVIRKSVSAEVNWGIRFTSQDQAEDFVKSLCGELNRRLVENLVKGKQLTLKVMRRSMDAPLEPVKHLGHGKCDIFNKSVVLGIATNATDIVAKEAISMLRSFNFSPGDLRGLGVQMTKLEPLKAGSSANIDSSQRQLNFAKSPSRKKTVTGAESTSPSKNNTPRIENQTPSRPVHTTPDIPGSQFIMPTQADPTVLSELPSDIRSRLVAQSKSPDYANPVSQIPAPMPTIPALPPQSQLDLDILAALPDDLRDEVLGYYNQQPSISAPSAVEAAPTPPPLEHVPRPSSSGAVGTKRPLIPPKRRRGRPPKFPKIDDRSQRLTNFVSRPTTAVSSVEPETPRQSSPVVEEHHGISADFLDALPEDIRQEILDEQRRSSSVQQPPPEPVPIDSGPDTEPEAVGSIAAQEDKRLPLPPLPERPVFTSQHFSRLPDLREAVGEWHSAFASHGPYSEDVEVLCGYLGRVIVDEKDIEKAVAVVRWLMWLVGQDNVGRGPMENQSPRSEQGFVTWMEAIEILQTCINTALEVRGLPPVDFD
ncbi:DNA repair protein Rev1 [Penicillium sp. IBT 16267x]|nr:DNA repair protein Rev1 [Penicillium sp. IBT 16267x]